MNTTPDSPSAREGTRVRSGAGRWLHLNNLISPIGFVIFIAVWEFAVRYFHIKPFILPAPTAIAARVISDATTGAIFNDFKITLIEVLGGFGLAVVLALVVGSAIALVRSVEKTIYPYILALQTVPKIAIAPLLIIWFGYGIHSKIVTAALIAFFPILVNVIAGLKTVEPRQILLMRALKANTLTTFIKVRLPSMLPYLFAGLEVGVIFSIIGAIVGEFIGASHGLGSLIIQRQAEVDVAGVFSVLIYLSAMGVTLNLILKAIARHYAFWTHESDWMSA